MTLILFESEQKISMCSLLVCHVMHGHFSKVMKLYLYTMTARGSPLKKLNVKLVKLLTSSTLIFTGTAYIYLPPVLATQKNQQVYQWLKKQYPQIPQII